MPQVAAAVAIEEQQGRSPQIRRRILAVGGAERAIKIRKAERVGWIVFAVDPGSATELQRMRQQVAWQVFELQAVASDDADAFGQPSGMPSGAISHPGRGFCEAMLADQARQLRGVMAQ